MFLKVLKPNIHRATVTAADLDYVGSITLDANLMDAAGILPFECVLVADVSNGTRHWTYAIAGERGSGVVCANGAAARLVEVGDLVIVMCFVYLGAEEVRVHRPGIIHVDRDNRILESTEADA